MNIKRVTINDCNEMDKLRFMKFIYNNTDSFILNDVMGSDHCPVGISLSNA